MADQDSITKNCNICHVDKPIFMFSKCKTGKYGVKGKCKECNKIHEQNLAKNRHYVLPDKLRCRKCNIEYECSIKYFKYKFNGKYKLTSECRNCLSKRNSELAKLPKYKEMQKKWNAKNIEKVRLYARLSSKKHKEKRIQYRKLWSVGYSDKRSEINKLWYENNKERLRDARKSWRLNNKDKTRVYTRNYRSLKINAGKHSKEDIDYLLMVQKNKCVSCKNNLNKYHVDHIFPLSKGGSNTKENLQLLCPKCNREKSDKDPIKFMQQKGYLL